MLKGRSKVRVLVSDALTRRDFAESRAILRQLFARLHEHFLEPVDKAIIEPSPGSNFWQDASYCYLEIDLTGFSISEVDINVTNGRAYIRVGR